jgi:RNA polymerase sigma-70 factor (ECF subfamily)
MTMAAAEFSAGEKVTDLAELTPEAVHARYAPKIRRHVGAIMGSDHELDDLVQEVLVVVLTKMSSVRDPARLDGWVFQVTANVLRGAIRRRRLRRNAFGRFVTEQQDSVFLVNFDASVVASRAVHVMERLPRNDRALLTAFWFGTDNAENIAARCGRSIFTVRRRLNRARARYRKLAQKDPALAQLA